MQMLGSKGESRSQGHTERPSPTPLPTTGGGSADPFLDELPF